jgi:hypothetical protein
MTYPTESGSGIHEIEAIQRDVSIMALADVIAHQGFTLVIGRKATEVTGTPIVAITGFNIVRLERPFHRCHGDSSSPPLQASIPVILRKTVSAF